MSSSWKNGFKVCRVCDGKYLSAVMATRKASEYKFNEPTYPSNGCGPLTVFTTYQAALDFVVFYECYMHSICRCQYVPSKHDGVWQHRIWEHTEIETTFKVEIDDLPADTELADVVVLTSELADVEAIAFSTGRL